MPLMAGIAAAARCLYVAALARAKLYYQNQIHNPGVSLMGLSTPSSLHVGTAKQGRGIDHGSATINEEKME